MLLCLCAVALFDRIEGQGSGPVLGEIIKVDIAKLLAAKPDLKAKLEKEIKQTPSTPSSNPALSPRPRSAVLPRPSGRETNRLALIQKISTKCPDGTCRMRFLNAKGSIESFCSNFRAKNS